MARIEKKQSDRRTVTVTISDAPETGIRYTSRSIHPDYAEVMFKRSTAPGPWTCVIVRISGFRLLTPGADGTLRVGKERHGQTYSLDYPSTDNPVPGWLAELVSKLHASL